MRRLPQFILIIATLLGSWLGMQLVHESGHVLGAWLSGGRVSRVVLWPLTLSRTDLQDNPRPLAVVWAGPLAGIALPALLWAGAGVRPFRATFVLRFFAGFCLLANGLYISIGSFDRVGDCNEMLRYGSQPWQLWLFGLLTAPLGLWLWHGQGGHFGLGRAQGKVDRGVAYGVLSASLALLLLGIIVGG